MKRGRGKTLNQEINLTNLVDVVFAILIVFIISAPLMSQGIQVDLPKAEAPTIEQKKLLKISISKEKEVFVADMKVELQDFDKVFKSIWDGESPVVVNADESIPYGLVMKVVSAIQAAGANRLGFLTLPPHFRGGK